MPHSCQTYSLPQGVELSFTDSGPPLDSNDYTTVVVIHGSVFNANQFQILHQYAHAHNLRTVLLHRRGYIGSTPYTSEELREIKHGSMEFWERLSAQLVQFLEMLVEKEHIPKLQKMSSHMSGGLAIMGWSAGCQMILALLGVAHSPMISNKVYVLLQNYIGKFLLYDPPYVAFGYPDPLEDIKYYVPWKDTSLPPEDLPVAFSEWVGSYYDHPYYEHEPRKSPSLTTIHDLDGLPKRKAENSLASWSDEEKTMGIEPQAGEAEVLTFAPPTQATLQMLSHKALFDPEIVRSWFPSVSVSYIGATRSIWVCVWAELQTKKLYEEAMNNGAPSSRPIRFIDIEGSNHFVHRDQPQEFLRAVVDGIRCNEQ